MTAFAAATSNAAMSNTVTEPLFRRASKKFNLRTTLSSLSRRFAALAGAFRGLGQRRRRFLRAQGQDKRVEILRQLGMEGERLSSHRMFKPEVHRVQCLSAEFLKGRPRRIR
jgi:hypothetical protein